MRSRRVLPPLLAVALLVSLGVAAFAQRGFLGLGGPDPDDDGPVATDNKPYDGRFVFVRLKYAASMGSFGRRFGRGPGWSHDYPRADVHFEKIVDEITLITSRTDGSNILGLDDPEIFRYPFAYMSEPGPWQPTDLEVEALRAYLLKGGFLVFDDFRGGDWVNLERQMQRVLPDQPFVEIDGTHPIFHAFFDIDDPLGMLPPYGGLPPSFYGIHRTTDPDSPLCVIANVNNDIGEYWEFSDEGLMPVDLSNEAYKIGVNYVVYAMTH